MFDQFLLLLKEQEPLISSVVGLATMFAAIWGVVQLMFVTGRNASRADSMVAPESVAKASHLLPFCWCLCCRGVIAPGPPSGYLW